MHCVDRVRAQQTGRRELLLVRCSYRAASGCGAAGEKRYAAEGGESVGSTPEYASKYLTAEIQRWAKVIKEAGVRSE